MAKPQLSGGVAPRTGSGSARCWWSGYAAEAASPYDLLVHHVVAGRTLGPLQVLVAGRLTMANGGTIKPRGSQLRDETPALRDPRSCCPGRGSTSPRLPAADRHFVGGVDRVSGEQSSARAFGQLGVGAGAGEQHGS